MTKYKSCILQPEAPNGEPSRLYGQLLKKLQNRPITNYIYAAYITSNMEEAMSKQPNKYTKNRQDQYDAIDVLDFIDFKTMLKDMTDVSIIGKQVGAIDDNNAPISYSNAEELLKKADDINTHYKGIVAMVQQYNNDSAFTLHLAEKNSTTHVYIEDVKTKLLAWNELKNAFESAGIDINNLPKDVSKYINPIKSEDIVQHLLNLKSQPFGHFTREEALLVFSLNPESPFTKRVANVYNGDLNAAATDIEKWNQLNIYPNQNLELLQKAIENGKQFKDIDLDYLKTSVANHLKSFYENSSEHKIKKEIADLNKKYHIENKEIHRTSSRIKSFEDAISEAAILLQRKIKILKQQGRDEESRPLEGNLDALTSALVNQKYCWGVMKFLEEANANVYQIDNLLKVMPTSGSELDKAMTYTHSLEAARSLIDQYLPIVEALANPAISIDETISKEDITNIRETANTIAEYLRSKSKVLESLTEDTMIKLMTETIGPETAKGISVANAIRMAATDSTKFDYLYSMGRASNPIVASIGSIIRNAQLSRNEPMNEISLRIRRATNKLYKSGIRNTRFMYEDEGHIASNIDWNKYEKEKSKAIKNFKKMHLKGFDLKQAIRKWIFENTEDFEVDTLNHRKERIPNSNYRKIEDFQRNWTDSQKEYYATMMQIKGEIGSMLPAYAQHQFLPPQIRRNFIDALSEAKSISDVIKAFKNKISNFWKIREDDEAYGSNGIIIDGEDKSIAEGDYHNNILRQIPIFYVNPVEQGELLRDFSSGITALAGTAVNYVAMNDIVDTVQFMTNFVLHQDPKDAKSRAEMLRNKNVTVFKDLWQRSINTNTHNIVQGAVSQQLYGEKIDPTENKVWSKIFRNIMNYTSFKGLATNFKGMVANALMGEFQMMIEAGAGEFYNFKDYIWANAKLFGKGGMGGDVMELLSNNMTHKSSLLREMFDPLQENFESKKHHRYHASMFRQMLSKDCSFIGYSAGEFFIHYINMYSILHHKKVKLNNKTISLFDAFEVTNEENDNAELVLKQGVTDLNGNPITKDYIDRVKREVIYANETTHGAMNQEDKGILHQRWWGRGIMNFRQWMVEHYSRRFRAEHWDPILQENREGYWYTLRKALFNEDFKDDWKGGHKKDALVMFIKDLYTFTLRSSAQWHNLTEQQKYNIKRVRAEMIVYLSLIGLNFVLGEPDEYKKEWARRFWMYQTKRAILDTEASMPHPKALTNALTILNSPMASLNTCNTLLYLIYGLFNGDMTDTIKTGDHKGEIKYWRNIKKYALPFFKDYEQMQKIGEDESIFKVFESTPSNY